MPALEKMTSQVMTRWQEENRRFRVTFTGSHWSVELSAPGESYSIHGAQGETMEQAIANVIWQMNVESMFLRALLNRYNSVTKAS